MNLFEINIIKGAGDPSSPTSEALLAASANKVGILPGLTAFSSSGKSQEDCPPPQDSVGVLPCTLLAAPAPTQSAHVPSSSPAATAQVSSGGARVGLTKARAALPRDQDHIWVTVRLEFLPPADDMYRHPKLQNLQAMGILRQQPELPVIQNKVPGHESSSWRVRTLWWERRSVCIPKAGRAQGGCGRVVRRMRF